MQVKVKLFGPQAQRVGRRHVRVELADDDATCAALRRALHEAAPQLADTLADSRFAVNHEYADESRTIRADDEVALIGMVSGG